jgi:hypothetical protein
VDEEIRRAFGRRDEAEATFVIPLGQGAMGSHERGLTQEPALSEPHYPQASPEGLTTAACCCQSSNALPFPRLHLEHSVARLSGTVSVATCGASPCADSDQIKYLTGGEVLILRAQAAARQESRPAANG